MAGGIFRDQGSNPCSPAWADGLLTNAPPGKSLSAFFNSSSKWVVNAAGTTCNINDAFGPGTANGCTIQWWFERFCKGDESLRCFISRQLGSVRHFAKVHGLTQRHLAMEWHLAQLSEDPPSFIIPIQRGQPQRLSKLKAMLFSFSLQRYKSLAGRFSVERKLLGWKACNGVKR